MSELRSKAETQGIRIERIKLAFSNAYILSGDRMVLVDTGSPGDDQQILEALEKCGLDRLWLILLTHAHSDHAGACSVLKQRTGVPVALGRGDVLRARSGRNGPLPPTRLMARLLTPIVDKPFQPITPDLLIDDSLDLHAFGLDATVIATPGHTAGSLSIVCSNGEAVVGDILMGGHMGGAILPHVPNRHYFVEDAKQNLASLDCVLSHRPTRLHVGHGGPLEATRVAVWRQRQSAD
ncbi:MAG: MBL fold metallo-hydrolase [Bradyrhizobium icense]|jgi:hydroxyacylglutathione hydrolase|nr:MAG: MBL fold metallo-hydrolase [Bradyrhizobium icense]